MRDIQEPEVSSQIYPRSNEPLRGQERERSNTHPEFYVPTSTDDYPSPAGAPSVQDTQFRSHIEDLVKAPTNIIVDEHNHQEFTPVAPVPLEIPTRSESLLSAATSSSPTTYPSPQSAITPMTRPLNISPKTSHDQLAPPVKPSINTAVPNVNSRGSANDNQSPKQAEPCMGLLNRLSASVSPSTPQAPLTTSFLLPQPHSRAASRESRISLPDEARRYYKNYSDSLLSSPDANATGGEGWTRSQPHAQLQGANGDPALSRIPQDG